MTGHSNSIIRFLSSLEPAVVEYKINEKYATQQAFYHLAQKSLSIWEKSLFVNQQVPES